jgi:hypothetical protein
MLEEGHAPMSRELKITRPNVRQHRYELVDKHNGSMFGDFACEGLLGRTCHASSGEQRWTFEARRPKVFPKEVRITPFDWSAPSMIFKLNVTNNCTVRLEDNTLYRLDGVSRFSPNRVWEHSPNRVWEDSAGKKIITYVMHYYKQLTGFVSLSQDADVNPSCALLVMLGLYLIEQNQRGLRVVADPKYSMP